MVAQSRVPRDFGQLAKLGIRTPEQLAPFILFDGARPERQLSVFDPQG